jgi:hypothetical protein
VPFLAKSRTLAGRRFIGKIDQTSVRVRALPGGEYRLLTTRLPDGSRVQDARDAEKEIRARLLKARADDQLINEAIAHFRAGRRVQLQQDVYEPRTGDVDVGLPLDEPVAPPEAALAMAFLFLALNVEDAIYPVDPADDPLADVRHALLDAEPRSPHEFWRVRPNLSWSVGTGRVDVQYEPAHMIGFDATSPPRIRIQLFRSVGWIVDLPAVAREPARVYFWTDLVTGEETATTVEGAS